MAERARRNPYLGLPVVVRRVRAPDRHDWSGLDVLREHGRAVLARQAVTNPPPHQRHTEEEIACPS